MSNKNFHGDPAKSKWADQKIKLKARFPFLLDADMHYDNGKKEEMFDLLEKKIGKTKAELKHFLEII